LPNTVDPTKKIKEMHYHHPVYNPKSLTARNRHEEINGVMRTYFCGAYWGYGFHEDGVNSALVVGKHFGKSL
jgi:predicted NAD/FAD-binding protein